MKSFDELWIELTEKIAADDKSSKSVELAKSGVHAIGKKVLEEAGEVWIAAEYQGDDQLAEEISQLIYHLQILMIARGLKPADIYRYL